MTRRIVAAVSMLVLIGLFGLVAGCGGDELPDNAVAQVGEVYITQETLDTRIAEFQAQYAGAIPDEATDPEGYKEFTQDVLDYLVTYELVQQKAGELNVSVTDADVQTEIDTILQDTFGGDQAQFDEALKAQNMTLDQLKVSYKESMLLQKTYEEVTKDVTTVPDADIAAYYEENKTDYFVDESRTARHILLSPAKEDDSTTTTTATTGDSTSTTAAPSTTTTAAPTEDDWEDALAEAEKVREELDGGGDWTALAAQYSDDTGTKETGGDLGVVSKGEMVAEFEESVFSLAKDEISQPIKTAYGYHIIQVTDITEAKQYTLEEVKEDISANLVNEAKAEAWQKWIEDTKAALGVTYKAGMEPTTTTTAAPTDTTSGGTDTTAAGTETTAGATATTEAGSTITTAAPETTTTVAP